MTEELGTAIKEYQHMSDNDYSIFSDLSEDLQDRIATIAYYAREYLKQQEKEAK